MVFVLLYIGTSTVVLPEKYPKDQCEALVKDIGGRCLPIPDYLPKSDKCTKMGYGLICKE